MPDEELDKEVTVLKQVIKLNEKGAKHTELLVEIRDIEKANGETLVIISNQKAAQANGDWWSRLLALVALAVAGATLYFSDSPFAQGVRAWLNQIGAL